MVPGNSGARDLILNFRFYFSPLVLNHLLDWAVVLTEGCRLLSKPYPLVTGVVKQVEKLIVCADACLSKKFWTLSKGKVMVLILTTTSASEM